MDGSSRYDGGRPYRGRADPYAYRIDDASRHYRWFDPDSNTHTVSNSITNRVTHSDSIADLVTDTDTNAVTDAVTVSRLCDDSA